MIDPSWSQARRVLAIRLDNLGDVLVTTPALHALKQALRAWLPEVVLFRKKQGFAMPLGNWIRRGLTKPGSRSSDRLQTFVDPLLVDRLRVAHASGRADHTAAIHSLSFLGQWLDKWEAA